MLHRACLWEWSDVREKIIGESSSAYHCESQNAGLNLPDMKNAIYLVAILCLIASAVLTGCGGSSASNGGTTTTTPAPTVTSISPTTATAGSGPLTLTVNGTGFQNTTTIQAGDVAEVTSYVSATQVTATLTAEQLASGGQLPIIALNGTASSGSGTAINLSVANPAPVISALTPAVLPAGSAVATLAVTGTGFVPTTAIDVNGSARTTAFVSATQVNVTLLAADMATVGSLALTAVNGTPGGGTSAAAAVAIDNPAPGAVITLSPGSAQVGTTTATTVTVTGTNFLPASTVQVNGAARATAYVSATQVTFQLTVADQAAAQPIPVTVVNPAPGGGSSVATTLTVANPAPGTTITLVPSSVTAGTTTPTNVTVTGTSFVPSSSVLVNGVSRSTTFVSATQLTFQLTVNDEANGQAIPVTVTSPAPGGGNSGSANITINNPAPTIAQPLPKIVMLGASSPVVVLVGTGFVPSTAIDVNGQARSTDYVSATQVEVVLTPADVAATGSLSLTAVNGTPGGATSAAATVAVNNPLPGGVVTLSPSMIATGATTPATITVTGTNFIPASTIQLGGSILGSTNTAVAVPTTYVSATQLTFVLTAAQQATVQQILVSVVNPTPGGGTTGYGTLIIYQQMPAPVIAQVSPSQLVVGSTDMLITVTGTNLFPQGSSTLVSSESTILWNDTALANPSECNGCGGGESISAAVPASLLTTVGPVTITVSNPESSPALSNALTVTIVNPPAPTLTSISPSGGPINTGATVTLNGTGFTANSTVEMNGTNIAATYVNSGELTVAVPASSVTLPGNLSFTVTTPAPGGGTTAPLPYTAYIGIPNNSMVYNPVNGLFYVSVPSAAGAPYGNSVVSVDPETGALGTPIQVGSEPDRLAISSDGTILWVGLDKASAVRQVNLTTGTAGLQFSLSGNSGIYATPPTVLALAALPGSPNSVVVATSENSYSTPPPLGIYDSGVLRGSGANFSAGALQVNGATNEIYAAESGSYGVFTYSASGLTQKGTASNGSYGSYSGDDLQVAGGKAYTDFGTVYDAEAGSLLGSFYVTGTTTAQGPTVADTTLGLVFILDTSSGYSYNSGNQIQSFNLSTYAATGSAAIPVSVPSSSAGSNSGPSHLTRWGTNGLAFRNGLGVISLRSNGVQDLSAVNADLGVTMTASGGTTTGTNATYTATVTNGGPSASTNIALTAQLPSTGVLISATPSAGTCTVSVALSCDLGGLANSGSATVTFVVQQTSAGTATMNVEVSGSENDPNTANNQAAATVTVTGSTYNLAPTLSAISPAAIEAGASDTVLTITGTGFSSASSVLIGSTVLTTSYTSSTSLTATVPAAQLANLGWAAITVSNPAPGGGASAPLPLTVFQVLTVGVNHILYEPFSREIYASVGSGSSGVQGNSIAQITPDTGTVGTPVFVGSQPTKMAISDDGNVLYALLGGANSVALFNLQTQTTAFTFTPKFTNYGGEGTGFRDVAVQPGSEDTIVVDFGYTSGMAIIDVNPTAQTAAIRGTGTSLYTGSGLQFYDPKTLYLFNIDTWQTLDKYGITPSGFANNAPEESSTLEGFGLFRLRGKLAFAQQGGLADVTTSPATQLGFYSPLVQYGGNQQVAPDTSLGQVFFLGSTSSSDSAYGSPDGIIAYNQATFMPNSVLPLNMGTIEGNTSYTGVDMIRWGQDGLAVLTSGGHIYLMRGPFVVPQLLNTNSAATLTSSSITSVTHGAGNTLLTLTGSNFIPGVAVNWNGSYRTTTIVDSAHVTVAIPASDLANSGTGSLVATNPGAPASSSLTITIN